MPDGFLLVNTELVIRLANELRLPTVYPFRQFVGRGGLISYGVDSVDLNWRAATYVDRVLKGANPADLPIQTPTKFELAINLKTAKRSASPYRCRCKPPPTRWSSKAADVRYWHLADIAGSRRCPLLGVKRTSPSALCRLMTQSGHRA